MRCRRGCAVQVQQELAADAVAVMRQAASLALRWGHAQVTPLHVATAVLSDAGGPLRAACLRLRSSGAPAAASHSHHRHPLQCDALELCFNMALSRLVTPGGALMATPAAMFHFRAAPPPALSNALAAAFKRAQAVRRRGGGQQHAAAGKVELEQLVMSILDDPSVSRVMREAGFSSDEVKAHVAKAKGVSSSEQQASANMASSSTTASASPNDDEASKANANANAMRVLDCMASGTNNHRCVVVLGESAVTAERVVKAVTDKVSNGELRRQHERLRNAQLVPFSAASFQRMPREEVEAWAGDLSTVTRECRAAGKGVVLVLEDLGYVAEAWAAAASWKTSDDDDDHRRAAHGRLCYYCPVQHAVMELSSILRGGDKDMFWLLGFGTYASYASCRSGRQPSLEAVLELHPIVVVPDGSSLAGDSEITHCGTGRVVASAASVVPSWLRRCCQGRPVITGSKLTLNFPSPASSSHCGFTRKRYEPWHDLMGRQTLLSLANPNSGYSNYSVTKSNPSDHHHRATTVRRCPPKFTELTAENLKILCSALETRVPRLRDMAPGIASAVLQRRSGVTRMTRPTSAATFFLFQGRDDDGKIAIARELARLVFGSYAEFTCIAAAAAASSKLTPDHDHHSLKRQRSSPDDNEHGGCMQMFYEAIRENPHRVVLIDGVKHDSDLEAGIMNAMASGSVRGCHGGVVSLEDSIVVCCQVLESTSSPMVSFPPPPVRRRTIMGDVVNNKVEGEKGVVPRFSLDLNVCANDVQGEEGGSSHNAMEILNAVDGVFFF